MKVFDFHGGNSDTVYLTQNDPDLDPAQLFVELRRSQWKEFGSPRTMTITFEPGDKLNEDI